MFCDRAGFISRLTLGIVAASVAMTRGLSAEPAEEPANRRWKGRRNSKVKRWDVVTVGNLARNRYWGEIETRQFRTTLCTCTLIQGEGFRMLVDPSLANAGQMAAELDRRTGLKLANIDAVFVTHHHGDHWFGLAHFPEAKWLAAPEVAEAINQIGKLPKPVAAVSGQVFDAIDIVSTPGHTLSHHSLRFDCDGLSIVVAGDAVMTRDFWRERQGHHNSADFTLAAQSMEKISDLADIVVPGHDNYFVNLTSR